MPPRPFTVAIPEAELQELRRRLARTRWAARGPGEGWEYGLDYAYLRALCDYWRDGFDWRKEESALNRLPQFVSTIDGVDLHYRHVRGDGTRPLPLLLLHGWPGSFADYDRLVADLTGVAPSFDVVVPSLPGYPMSGKPPVTSWGVTRIAAAFDQLMRQELGYRRYAIHGELEWGGAIAAKMASAYPEHVSAIHVTHLRVARPPARSEEERRFQEQWKARAELHTAYRNVYRQHPDRTGIAQTDSPAGFAAWVVERLNAFADGGVAAFDRDTILRNLTLYWATDSVNSAARLFAEYGAARDPEGSRFPRVTVPTAVAVFPADLENVPRSWVEPHFNVQRWTEMPRGGRFAALEEPALVAEDIRAFLV